MSRQQTVAARLATPLRSLFGCLLASFLTAPAFAEPPTATVITPLKSEQEVNDVNVATGMLRVPTPSLSIPAAPRLRFDVLQNAVPYLRANISGGISGSGWVESSIAIHTGASSSESFSCTFDDWCQNKKQNGSMIEGSIPSGGPYTFTESGTGAVYQYNSLRYDNGTAQSTRQVQYYATSITYPDGEVIFFTYDKAAVGNIMHHRMTRMSSSLGYSIDFTYVGTDVNYPSVWGRVSQATLYKGTAPTVALGQLTFAIAGNGIDYTITDIAGRVYSCTGCGNSLGSILEVPAMTVKLPTETGNSVTVTDTPLPSGYTNYPASVVSSVVRDGVAWNYAYTNLRLVPNGHTNNSGYSYDKMTVTGPNGYNVVYNVSWVGLSANLVTYVVDSIGRTTSYGYDSTFRLTTVTNPEGNWVQLTYDDYGNVTSKTNNPKPGSGLAATSESSAINAGNCAAYRVLCFRPVTFTDALNRTTTYVYDTAGRLTQRIDPADGAGVQRATYLSYGTSLTAPSEVRVCALGSTCGTSSELKTQYTYVGSTALVATETVIDGMAATSSTTSYTYDDAGRVLITDGPLAGTDDARYFRYDVLGRKIWEVGPKQLNGYRQATRTTYRDSDDKVTTVETGLLTDPYGTTLGNPTSVATSYDMRRNPVRVVTSVGGTPYTVADASFDDRGRNTCATVRMNTAAFGSLPSDACTLGTTGSQGPDRIKRNNYDAASQLLQVQKAYGTSLQQNYVTYTYSGNGKQTSVTDANGNLASLTYDGFDRQTAWTFPSKTTPGQVNAADYEAYGYDAVGNRTSLRKRDGVTLTYQYDNRNQLALKTVPGSASGAAGYSVHYGYDVRGLQSYARFGSASGAGVSTSYDGYGRPSASITTMGSVSLTLGYQYNAAGARTRVTHPDGTFASYIREPTGALYYADLNSITYLFHPTYDAEGRVGTLYRWAGGWSTATGFSYDPISRPTQISHSFVGGSGNVSSTFAYNPASQIVARTRDNDAYRFQGYVNVNRAYVTNGLNQYTSAGLAGFSYDANGNLTGDGSNSYVYDAENRLVSASNGTSLSYDPLGRLWDVTKNGSSTRFLYDGDKLVAEYDGAGNMLKRYVHGDGDDTPQVEYQGAGVSSPRYLYTDHQGSVVSIADAGGSIAAINGYDEYGIPAATNTGRFQYTGQAWLAELGMYHYKARIYSPTLGRFLQTDSIGYDDQINLYAYVANDPVNGRDPTGKETCVSNGDSTQTCTSNGSIFDNAALALRVGYEWLAYKTGLPSLTPPLRNEEAAPPERDESKVSDRPAGPDGKSGATGGPGAGKRFDPETPERKASKEGVGCRYCGQSTTNTPGRGNSRERDHIDPKSRGGNNSPENEGDSCRDCNRSKGARNPDEWPKRDRISDAYYIINRYNVRFVSFG